MVSNVSTVGFSPTGADEVAARATRTRRILQFCRRELLGTFGLLLVLLIAITGILAELLAPYSPTANDFGAMMEAPSAAHLLGTDQFGRDSAVAHHLRRADGHDCRPDLGSAGRRGSGSCWVSAAPISAAWPT